MGSLRARRASAIGGALGVSIACTEYQSSFDRGPPDPLTTGDPDMAANVRGTPAVVAPNGPMRGGDSSTALMPSGAAAMSSLADAGPGDAGNDSAAPQAPTLPEEPDAARADCLDGSIAVGSCYRASPGPLAWTQARADCLAWGGDLVSIQTIEEDVAVASLLDVSVWIGASDQTTDGTFTWGDGSAVVFGNWGAGQPDAFPGPDCVEKRQEVGEAWYDQPCANAEAYVCERELPP